MDFTVVTGDEEMSFTGDSRYKLDANGVLTVVGDDGTRVQFSPVGWIAVKDTPPPRKNPPRAATIV
jgi:hypothetical protein